MFLFHFFRSLFFCCVLFHLHPLLHKMPKDPAPVTFRKKVEDVWLDDVHRITATVEDSIVKDTHVVSGWRSVVRAGFFRRREKNLSPLFLHVCVCVFEQLHLMREKIWQGYLCGVCVGCVLNTPPVVQEYQVTLRRAGQSWQVRDGSDLNLSLSLSLSH